MVAGCTWSPRTASNLVDTVTGRAGAALPGWHAGEGRLLTSRLFGRLRRPDTRMIEVSTCSVFAAR